MLVHVELNPSGCKLGRWLSFVSHIVFETASLSAEVAFAFYVKAILSDKSQFVFLLTHVKWSITVSFLV